MVREPGRRDARAVRWLFHVVRAGEGPAAPGSEGFVHCSYKPEVLESARLYFPKDARLEILRIDPRLVAARIDEADTPRGKMPHVHGLIPAAAVVERLSLDAVPAAPDEL